MRKRKDYRSDVKKYEMVKIKGLIRVKKNKNNGKYLK
jgi:hypothetical protein